MNLEERHEILKDPPSPEDFEEKHFNMLFDFLVKYVVKLYGVSKIRATMAANPGTGLIDIFTASDIGYLVGVFEDKLKVWQQQAMLLGMSKEERERVERIMGMSEKERGGEEHEKDYIREQLKFTNRRGVKYDYLGSGWSKEGVKFFKGVMNKWRELMRNEEWWEQLTVAWEEYESEKGIGKMWKKTVSRN